MLTIDQTIQDAFWVRYCDLRKELFDDYKKKDIIMKLLHKEHISAVYCKEQLKYYENTEDHYDYPKEIVQAYMNLENITITYNAILSLTDTVTSSRDETTVITDKSLIPMDVMIGCMWDHITSSHDNNIKLCHQHVGYEYVYIDGIYEEFVSCFQSYLTNYYICSKGDINWYEHIHVMLNRHCQCSLRTTRIDIFDLCVLPAIDQLYHVIISSLYAPFFFKEYSINDLLLMGSPILTDEFSYLSMEIVAAIKKKFDDHQKYHKARISWIDEDMDTMIYNAMKSIAEHPESGLCEQVPSVQYGYGFKSKKRYYLDFNRGCPIAPEKTRLLREHWYVSEDDLFSDYKTFVIYSEPDAVTHIDRKSHAITHIILERLFLDLQIYFESEGVAQLLSHNHIYLPQNGFPLVLKQFIKLGSVYFLIEDWKKTIEEQERGFAYLTSDNYVHVYEPTTLQIIFYQPTE